MNIELSKRDIAIIAGGFLRLNNHCLSSGDRQKGQAQLEALCFRLTGRTLADLCSVFANKNNDYSSD